jgi:hypothetical protein
MPKPKSDTITLYRLKVSLDFHRKVPMNKLHRIIELSENATFEDLHNQIFEAFERFDPHMYRFYLTRNKKVTGMRALYDCPDKDIVGMGGEYDEKSYQDATTYRLQDANLKEKDLLYYWFDFGDDWIHRIRVEKISSFPTRYIEDYRAGEPVVGEIRGIGEAPPQYDDEEESVWQQVDENPEAQIGILVMSLANPELQMLGEKQMTYRDLLDVDILEPMLDNKLIMPFADLDNAIQLTPLAIEKGKALFEMMKNGEFINQ